MHILIVRCTCLSGVVHLTLTSFSWFISQYLVFLVKSVSKKLKAMFRNMSTIFGVLNECKVYTYFSFGLSGCGLIFLDHVKFK